MSSLSYRESIAPVQGGGHETDRVNSVQESLSAAWIFTVGMGDAGIRFRSEYLETKNKTLKTLDTLQSVKQRVGCVVT